MHDELNELARVAAQFLQRNLPTTDPTWWPRYVVDQLTYAQQRSVSERGFQKLTQLDLAALLRVVDRNWDRFRTEGLVTYESRNWLKEAQVVRNRWAHAGVAGISQADQYRDLDTICRLVGVLGGDDELLTRLRSSRDGFLHADQSIAVADASTEVDAQRPVPYEPPTLPDEPTSLPVGSQVRVVARPDDVGVILQFIPAEPEARITVFHDATRTQTYYESQVELVPTSSGGGTASPARLAEILTARQLLNPSSRYLYSLHSAKIDFVPYQFRPVIKLIKADRPRLLIADDVGVGKTIEAGLIMKELQARQEVNSVLVICPKPLVTEHKWRDEMRRFDEQFEHLDGRSLRYCIDETDADGQWPARYQRAILPYSLLDETHLLGSATKGNRKLGLIDLDPPPHFDLVIVDEAHHARNPATWRHRAVQYFCDNAEAVIFLSATPIQLGNADLFNLLRLLRPDLIQDRGDFERMAKPNQHTGLAAKQARAGGPEWQALAIESVDRALETEWGSAVMAGDVSVQGVLDLLKSPQDDASRIEIIRRLEELNSFSSLINRTRRRDIGEFTTRKPRTIEIEFTRTQRAVHDALLEVSRSALELKHGTANVGLMLSMLQRQVASCVNGLIPLLDDLIARRVSDLDLSESGIDGQSFSGAEIFANATAELRAAGAQVGDTDPKFDAFYGLVSEKLTHENPKTLVFSTFRHTLRYLNERLVAHGVRVGLVHGDVEDDDRRSLRRRFALSSDDPESIDVLLSSEVGTEGLDYQFCDTLINYDLPWNPMRIEQRIGRLDRRGQLSESIDIVNMVTTGTVDADIYFRCLERIGVFERALGAGEEILGDVTRDIQSIAENMALTPDERQSRLQQLADNEISVIQEQQRLETEQSKLFGLDVQDADEERVANATSQWLSAQAIGNLISRYLASTDPEMTIAEDTLLVGKAIRLSDAAVARLLIDLAEIGEPPSETRIWRKTIQEAAGLRLTVDPQLAEGDSSVVLVGPSHPLTRCAARAVDSTQAVSVSLQAESSEVPVGTYPFAVYAWNRIGLRTDFEFETVSTEVAIEPMLADLVQRAIAGTGPTLGAAELESLEKIHYARWIAARAEHRLSVSETITMRLDSLRATHSGRIAILEAQRDQVADQNIRRMRESQIASAEREYARRAAQMEAAMSQVDITRELLAYGTLEVLAAR